MDIQGLRGDHLAHLLICLHENIVGLLFYSFEVICSYLKEGFLRGGLNSTHIVLDYQGFIFCVCFLRQEEILSIFPQIREITVILANLAFSLSNVIGHKETWRRIWILWER